MVFKKISTIGLGQSFKDSIFITIDIDWCADFVLEETINILSSNQISATFFATHKTDLLDEISKNHLFELGIHPNFNPLLSGDFRYGKDFKSVIDYFLDIVPSAKSVRSHSMTQNTPILKYFSEVGLEYDCNTFIPFDKELDLKPWSHWDLGLLKVPYFWEDDVHCLYGHEWDIGPFVDNSGLKVFDFHPIHLFLNTETMERYEKSRDFQQNKSELLKFVNNTNIGSREFLMNLRKRLKDA